MNLLQSIRNSIRLNFLPPNWHSQKTKFILIENYAYLKDITAVYDTYNRKWISKGSSIEAIFFQDKITVQRSSAVFLENGENNTHYVIDEASFEHFGIIKCEYNTYAFPTETTVINGTRYSNRSLFYWESDGTYRLEAEYDDDNDSYNDDNLFDYHSVSRIEFSLKAKFRVGFEIEKEDEDLKDDIEPEYYYDKHKFIFERDGSLDDGGFELISPTFNLFDKKLIEKFKPVERYVNADYSDNCGGHIHLSLQNHTGIDLFKRIVGWLPLFYAMYPKRVCSEYCQASSSEYIISDRPRGAVNILQNRVELRIFSAVKNMDTLRFRITLLRFIARNLDITAEEVMKLLINRKSGLFKHLTTTVYTSTEKYSAMLLRMQQFNIDYEKKYFSEETINRIQKFNQKNNSICASSF